MNIFDLSSLTPAANHLWQSTVFVGVIWVLTLGLKRNRAAVRYWLWFAASAKFFLPFSALIALGSRSSWRTAAPIAQPQWSFAIDSAIQPFVAPTAPTEVVSSHASFTLTSILVALWLCGVAVGVAFWLKCWMQMRRVRKAATPLPLGLTIPTLSSPSQIEPGVFGIFRPVLLLPEGLESRLNPAQLDAIVAHEMTHVRRRDNLTAAIHMLVETVFWFFPLVWWIRARLVEEREHACDEEVLRLGAEPHSYAEGIVNVCKSYIESPVACVSGISGSNLRKRIEEIMASSIGIDLDWKRKFVLIGIGITVVTAPLAIGNVSASPVQAQSQSATPLSFEVASVKANPSVEQGSSINPSPGMFNATNVSLQLLIQAAYSVRSFQVSGGPAWINTEKFDVVAKTQGSVPVSQVVLMLQTLLENRFNLKVHRESRELPVFTLSIGRGGLKVRASSCTPVDPIQPSTNPKRCGQMSYGSLGLNKTIDAVGVTMSPFAATLSQMVGRTVLDRTGFTDPFDFHLEWLPETVQDRNLGDNASNQMTPSDAQGASIFSALQEQLGLKLESGKGPVEVIVIDHVEEPTPN